MKEWEEKEAVVDKRKNGTDAEHCADAYADVRAVNGAESLQKTC